jgi:hypothetical protein
MGHKWGGRDEESHQKILEFFPVSRNTAKEKSSMTGCKKGEPRGGVPHTKTPLPSLRNHLPKVELFLVQT